MSSLIASVTLFALLNSFCFSASAAPIVGSGYSPNETGNHAPRGGGPTALLASFTLVASSAAKQPFATNAMVQAAPSPSNAPSGNPSPAASWAMISAIFGGLALVVGIASVPFLQRYWMKMPSRRNDNDHNLEPMPPGTSTSPESRPQQ